MMQKSFTGTLDQMLEMIAQALTAIEQGGGQPELQSLQKAARRVADQLHAPP